LKLRARRKCKKKIEKQASKLLQIDQSQKVLRGPAAKCCAIFAAKKAEAENAKKMNMRLVE